MTDENNVNGSRFALREQLHADGKVDSVSPLFPTLNIEPSYIERGLFGGLGAGKLLTMVMRKNFFEPITKDMNRIREPGAYGLKNTDQAAFDKKGDLQLWVSEPIDKAKGYVVYFEGMGGHWGDVGAPKLAIDHNRAQKMKGLPETKDIDPENRDYRIKRLKALQDHGYGIIAVHLPGFGASKGIPTEANYYKAIDDALIPWLSQKSNDIDLNNLTIMGASQGTASATYMAGSLSQKKHPPKLLTLVAPPLSSADSVLDAESHDAPDLLKKIGLRNQAYIIQDHFAIAPMIADVSTNTKVMVVAAEDDFWVPHHHVNMVALAARKTQHETRLVLDKKSEHCTINPTWMVDNMDAFLNGKPAIDPYIITEVDGPRGYTANMMPLPRRR